MTQSIEQQRKLNISRINPLDYLPEVVLLLKARYELGEKWGVLRSPHKEEVEKSIEWYNQKLKDLIGL